MPRTPAKVTQADVARCIRAARQEGATEVEVRLGEASSVIIRMASSTPSTGPAAEAEEEIVL